MGESRGPGASRPHLEEVTVLRQLSLEDVQGYAQYYLHFQSLKSFWFFLHWLLKCNFYFSNALTEITLKNISLGMPICLFVKITQENKSIQKAIWGLG